METLIIRVNRTKIIVALVSMFILFAYGCYLAFYVANDPTSHFDSTAMAIIGYILIGLFGLVIGAGFIRLISLKGDALVLTDSGFEVPILDPQLGHIPWDDVYKVEVDAALGVNKALFIYVNDAQKYIDKASDKRKKRILRNQSKNFGTPFTIMTMNLKVNKTDLDRMVRERWKARKTAIEALEAANDQHAG